MMRSFDRAEPPLKSSEAAAIEEAAPLLREYPIFLDNGINESIYELLQAGTRVPRVKRLCGESRCLRECPHPAGVWPTIERDGTIINGGIPQHANLTLHLNVLNATLTKYMPLNSTGWIDLDFEAWNLLWDRLPVSPEAPGAAAFRRASIASVKARYPSLNDTHLTSIAKAEYEQAGMNFFLSTIHFVRSGWPFLKIGVYSYPQRFYYGGYATPAGPLLRAQNDQLAPLWCALDGLFPSVYQFFDGSKSASVLARNRAYVRSTVAEARRIANAVPNMCRAYSSTLRPRPPVIAYGWNRYHASGRPNWTYPFLSDVDMALYWQEASDAGADALTLWGDERFDSKFSGGHSFDSFKAWWNEHFAPAVNKWNPQR